jgi:hypothetical protein
LKEDATVVDRHEFWGLGVGAREVRDGHVLGHGAHPDVDGHVLPGDGDPLPPERESAMGVTQRDPACGAGPEEG